MNELSALRERLDGTLNVVEQLLRQQVTLNEGLLELKELQQGLLELVNDQREIIVGLNERLTHVEHRWTNLDDDCRELLYDAR